MRAAAAHAPLLPPPPAASCSGRAALRIPARAPNCSWLPTHPQASLKKKEAELELVAPYSRSYGRTMVKSVLENESEGLSLVSLCVAVVHWLGAIHNKSVVGAG